MRRLSGSTTKSLPCKKGASLLNKSVSRMNATRCQTCDGIDCTLVSDVGDDTDRPCCLCQDQTTKQLRGRLREQEETLQMTEMRARKAELHRAEVMRGKAHIYAVLRWFLYFLTIMYAIMQRCLIVRQSEFDPHLLNPSVSSHALCHSVGIFRDQ